jgi:hypothetical protein
MTAMLEENKLCWGNCISVCIDGAPAITGRIKDFISRLQQDFPNVGSTRCFLHREALVAKTIPAALRSVMDLEMFPLTADTSCLILEHLSVLGDKLKQYFPSINVNEYD